MKLAPKRSGRGKSAPAFRALCSYLHPLPPPNNNLSLAPQHRFLGLDQKKGMYMRTMSVGGVVGDYQQGEGDNLRRKFLEESQIR